MTRTLAVCLSILALSASALAESVYSIRIHGRREVTITTPSISLADLAEVSSDRLGDEETVIGLKKLYIEKAPAPGETLTISAAQLLTRLREEGVDLQKVGYSLPRVMSAKRASRTLMKEEIRAAIELFLKNSGKEATLKEVQSKSEVHLLPGLVSIKAIPFEADAPGRMNFAMTAEVEGQEPVRFNVDALVDEWREVPAAKRPLNKGAVVSESDLMMARLNVHQIPRDVILDRSQIVGMETAKDLNSGELFRSSKIEQPAAVVPGDRVTMVYRKGLLEATAKGIAIDSGSIGQTVRIKNESSKRIVSGTIKEQGLVEVQP